MIGAIIGDIVGSRFEFNNHRSKDFDFFHKDCFFTDDTVMTLAVASALKKIAAYIEGTRRAYLTIGVSLCDLNMPDMLRHEMRRLGRKYPDRGYGARFARWLWSDDSAPYGSYGNGSAMRISPVAYACPNAPTTKHYSRLVSCVTHDHPEGIRGAEAVAMAILRARQQTYSKETIARIIHRAYYPQVCSPGFTLDRIRDTYAFDETCQGSVPQAIQAFCESRDFEDAIRNAVSIGGDSDTIAAITGSIAGAYYGVPEEMEKAALTYLTPELRGIYERSASVIIPAL